MRREFPLGATIQGPVEGRQGARGVYLAIELRGRRAECDFLEGVLADARAGRSRAVVLRGEAGAGKTALLDFVAEQASGWRIATAVGVESEMELAYSGLHQLCVPMLEHLDRLPEPQRAALATV